MNFEEAWAQWPEAGRVAVLDVQSLVALVRGHPWEEGLDKLADVISRYDLDETRALLLVAILGLAHAPAQSA